MERRHGKELIARAIHDLSPRRSKPFVKLNCAAIPTACSKASCSDTRRAHSPERSRSGLGDSKWPTVARFFLDEIGEIPLELQTKLLRVLQEREFERWEASRHASTDARLIAATNRDLEAMVSEQKFRSDLFFRLNVFPVHVPPLREREGDIPLLVRHFTQQFSRHMKKVMERFHRHDGCLCRWITWPGTYENLFSYVWKLLREVRTRSGMSPSRSRKGGTWTGKTFNRKKRSDRNFCSLTIASKSRFRRGNQRGSVRSVRELPNRSNSLSCSTRSSLVCSSRGISLFHQGKSCTVGHFESPNPLRDRSGECALLVSEQLAFEQACRNCRTIELDRTASSAVAQIMNGTRNQFFPRARLSINSALSNPSALRFPLL